MKDQVILSNSGYCTSCNSYIYSGHRHDFVSCECGSVSVDGGGEYLRRVGGLKGGFKDTSIVISKEVYDEAFGYIKEGLELTGYLERMPTTTVLVLLVKLKLVNEKNLDISSYQCDKAIENFKWALETGRNEYGIICAVARGYKELPNKRWFE